MIDIESDIVDVITTALEERFPGISVYDEEILTPSSFPCVTVEEADNYSYQKTADSKSNENHAVLMYEINVYSNKANGKKRECKNIYSFIDEILLKMGFSRISTEPASIDSTTIYRLVGRYKAVADKNKTIYGG